MALFLRIAILWLYASPAGPPALPHYERNACPGEGCSFRDWGPSREFAVYDTYREGRRIIGHVGPASGATALTGILIVFRPGVVRMDRDLPDHKLKRGETILTYNYEGEGYFEVWVHGGLATSFDLTFAKRLDGTGCAGSYCAAHFIDAGEKTWWVNVKLKDGRTGWVDMEWAP